MPRVRRCPARWMTWHVDTPFPHSPRAFNSSCEKSEKSFLTNRLDNPIVSFAASTRAHSARVLTCKGTRCRFGPSVPKECSAMVGEPRGHRLRLPERVKSGADGYLI